MDVIRVHAPSEAQARRLVTSLDGNVSSSIDGSGNSHVVGLKLDPRMATKLLELFNALGEWLNAAGLTSCRVTFGDREYSLLSAKPGEPNDATTFLLERTIQLQTALDSRVVIEQAKGILAERHSIRPDEAFERIRSVARRRRTKLRDIAAGIVDGSQRIDDSVRVR